MASEIPSPSREEILLQTAHFFDASVANYASVSEDDVDADFLVYTKLRRFLEEVGVHFSTNTRLPNVSLSALGLIEEVGRDVQYRLRLNTELQVPQQTLAIMHTLGHLALGHYPSPEFLHLEYMNRDQLTPDILRREQVVDRIIEHSILGWEQRTPNSLFLLGLRNAAKNILTPA